MKVLSLCSERQEGGRQTRHKDCNKPLKRNKETSTKLFLVLRCLQSVAGFLLQTWQRRHRPVKHGETLQFMSELKPDVPSAEPWGPPQDGEQRKPWMSHLSIEGVHLLQDISEAAVLWLPVNGRSRQQIEQILLKEWRLRADGQLWHSVLKTQ